LNFRANQTRCNNVIAPLGANGDITIDTSVSGSVHIVIDVLGYYQ